METNNIATKMTQEQQEAFGAVEKINEELFNKYNKKNNLDNLPTVSITFADRYMFIGLSIPSTIDLPEISLYSSENNNRIYYEKGDKYETFYKYIKRRFLEVKEEIYSVKL